MLHRLTKFGDLKNILDKRAGWQSNTFPKIYTHLDRYKQNIRRLKYSKITLPIWPQLLRHYTCTRPPYIIISCFQYNFLSGSAIGCSLRVPRLIDVPCMFFSCCIQCQVQLQLGQNTAKCGWSIILTVTAAGLYWHVINEYPASRRCVVISMTGDWHPMNTVWQLYKQPFPPIRGLRIAVDYMIQSNLKYVLCIYE